MLYYLKGMNIFEPTAGGLITFFNPLNFWGRNFVCLFNYIAIFYLGISLISMVLEIKLQAGRVGFPDLFL